MHRVNVPILKRKRRESSKEKGVKQGETQQEKHQIMKLRVGLLEILAITWVPADWNAPPLHF